MRALKARPGARLLSIQQVSDEFGFTSDTLRRLIAERKLPAVEMPGIRRACSIGGISNKRSRDGKRS